MLDLGRHVGSIDLSLYASQLPRRRLVLIESILLGLLGLELKVLLWWRQVEGLDLEESSRFHLLGGDQTCESSSSCAKNL
jgi:hypothetical protein